MHSELVYVNKAQTGSQTVHMGHRSKSLECLYASRLCRAVQSLQSCAHETRHQSLFGQFGSSALCTVAAPDIYVAVEQWSFGLLRPQQGAPMRSQSGSKVHNLHMLKELTRSAVVQALALSEQNKEVIRADKLQKLHTLHNLAQLVKEGGLGGAPGVPHTLRDSTLQSEAQSLRDGYLAESIAKLAVADRDYQETLSAMSIAADLPHESGQRQHVIVEQW